MKILESYRNREQAYVKHHLLRAYLERLFMIIGRSQSTIRYVDCFSGPWNEQDENLQAAFGELVRQGMVVNLGDETKRRRKKYVRFHAHHNQGEQLIRLTS